MYFKQNISILVALTPIFLLNSFVVAQEGLLFSDEFDGTELDTNKWRIGFDRKGDFRYSDKPNGELQWYQAGNIVFADGELNLIAKKEKKISPISGDEFSYTSGMITSKPSFNFTYGYFEAKMLLPKGSGFWPAFWTWPTREAWPPEIDAVEFYGDNVERLYLTGHSEVGSIGGTMIAKNWTLDWHVIGVDWQPGRLTWYIDDNIVYSITESPSEDMYLILNLAISDGSGAPTPNAETPFPSTYKFDYVRVYKSYADKPQPTSINRVQQMGPVLNANGRYDLRGKKNKTNQKNYNILGNWNIWLSPNIK